MSGDFFRHAFELTNNLNYLNETIEVYRGILKMPCAQYMHAGVERLAPALLFRSAVVNNPRDLDEMMQILPIATAAAHTEVPT